MHIVANVRASSSIVYRLSCCRGLIQFLFALDIVLSYLTLFFLFGEAFMSLILWRGQSTISLPMLTYATPTFFKWIDVRFPLNSLALFVCLIILVENYDLLPAFFFASVGWYVLKCVCSSLRCCSFSSWLLFIFHLFQGIAIHIGVANGQSKPLDALQGFFVSPDVVDYGG
jgi:hypothetical protein